MNDVSPIKRHLFAWDPGAKTHGFAWFELYPDHVNLRAKEKILHEKINPRLDLIEDYMEMIKEEIVSVVVENYRVRNELTPGSKYNPRARSNTSNGANSYGWDEVLTIRRIGMFERHAHVLGAEVTMSEPKTLAQGRKWCDFPVPKNPATHIDDDISAYIHGAKFLMDYGFIRSVDEIVKFGQATIDQVDRMAKKANKT